MKNFCDGDDICFFLKILQWYPNYFCCNHVNMSCLYYNDTFIKTNLLQWQTYRVACITLLVIWLYFQSYEGDLCVLSD